MTFKNILITGGAGFIGSHVVEHLATNYRESRLIILDKLTYAGSRANIDAFVDDERVLFVEGDICDAERVERLFAEYGIDAVMHLAAESHVDRSISAPMLFAQNNILGTITLLEAARKAWHGREAECRFLHVSTDEVYGALAFDAEPFTEQSRYEPHSPYSASKASSDHFARAYHDTYGLPTIVTNCSNNYGPRQYPEKLIPLFINNIVERKPLPVYGSGMNIRDWLYVGDHAEALATALHRGTVGETYNIGGNNEWSNIELIKELIRLTDKALGRAEGESLTLISHVEDRAGHDLRYAIDASKIERELGWRPRTSFDKGLQHTVEWYLG
jgi:dTDP-glucose 4,6-dehydratase